MGPGSDPPVGDEELEKEVQELAARVASFREKGIESFTRLSELNPTSRILQDHGQIHSEGVPMDSESEERDKKLQSVLARLAAAEQAVPPLLKELAMWEEKLEQALETLKKLRKVGLPDVVL